jgi:HK97 family phage major capsid protein
MKLTKKEMEAQLAIARTLSGSVRKSFIASLKSAEVVDEDGSAIEFSISDEAEVETKSVEEIVEKAVEKAVEKEPKLEVKSSFGKVFAQPKRYYGKLKSFSGQNAEYDAFLTGKWLMGLNGDQEARQFCVNKGLSYKASSGSTIGAGGALVPDVMAAALIRNTEENGIRRYVNAIPMTNGGLIIPLRSSGMTAAWFGQGASVTASNSVFAQVSLTAKKLGITHLMSTEIGEDAIIPIADALIADMATAFGDAESDAFWNGDGTSTYGTIEGLLVKANDGNHAGTIYTAATGNTSFGELDLADFHGVVGKCPLYARSNAKWYVSAPGFSASMERLAYAGGGNTVQNINGSSGLSFLGYPVVLDQKMNSVLTAQTSTVVLAFGDLSKSTAVGDARQFNVKSDGGLGPNMASDQITLLATERLDIAHHSLGDGTNAGPVVVLKTPGA